EGGVATSGDYERFFEMNGVRYAHILNPKTGYPITGTASVTVHGESCLLAGTAATIAMLHGSRGLDCLNELGVPYLLVDQELNCFCQLN
ncbi:MAG TPA: thiamine biosynthesis protein ApbE, partial [Gammaproteobacteria bacterium]|nr:thiamine biosynthesis protein ApbE [Gammaproteobacteria bacterium]